MMKLKLFSTTIILQLIIYTTIRAQTNTDDIENSLKIKIDSLSNVIEQLENDIKDQTTRVITNSNTHLKRSPNFSSRTIAKIPRKTILSVINTDEEFYIVRYKNKTGFVHQTFVDEVVNLKKIELSTLEDERKKLTKNLNRITEKREKQIVQSKIDHKRIEYESKLLWIKSLTGNIREEPSTQSKIIMNLNQGNIIYFQQQAGEWVKVKIRKSSRLLFDNLSEFENNYIDGWIHRSIVSKTVIRELTKSEVRRRLYVKNHPNLSYTFKNAILNGSIVIGMTTDMVIASWGYPEDKNRSVYSWGVNEQWIYGGSIRYRKYLYFENGKLTSWQE